MEYGLGLTWEIFWMGLFPAVLILVLLEYGLGEQKP